MTEIESSQLEAMIRDTRDALLVVKFGAPWCRPCEMVQPQFAAYEEECKSHGSSIRCVSVNIDELDDPELYNIQLIPMFVVWFQGRELKRTNSSVMEDVRKLVQESYDIACRGD